MAEKFNNVGLWDITFYRLDYGGDEEQVTEIKIIEDSDNG